jgi:hypothetical protein
MRLASGRGGALAKDDRINENNTFDNRSQVLTVREWAKSEGPSSAIFARTSDLHARQQADILTRTLENPFGARFLCTRETGGEQGQAYCTLVASHRR